MQVTLEDIPAGSITRETISRMYSFINRAKTDAKFISLVHKVINASVGHRAKDYFAEVSAWLTFVKKTITYRRDPSGVELVRDVWNQLSELVGDCDDMAVLSAAGFEVLGAPSRLVVISTRPSKEPSHVYVQVYVNGRWLGADAIVPESYIGWEPQQFTDKKVWSRASVGLAGDEEESMEGLGMGYGLGLYQPDRSARTYLTMEGLNGLGGSSILDMILGGVAAAGTAIAGQISSGQDVNIAAAAEAAAAKLAAEVAAKQAAELAAAKNQQTIALLQAKQAADNAAAAAALQRQIASDLAAKGVFAPPPWLIPLAAGVGILGVAMLMAKKRR